MIDESERKEKGKKKEAKGFSKKLIERQNHKREMLIVTLILG